MRISLLPVLLILLLSSPTYAQTDASEQQRIFKKELGIARTALSRSKQKEKITARLEVRLKTEHRCTFSDFDAIAFDAMYSERPNVLISLEPIVADAHNFAPRTSALDKPHTLREKGLSIQFSFPFPDQPQLLGLFICSDSQGEGRCNTTQKEIADFGTIFPFYTEIPAKSYTAPDRIYYFRPIIVSRTEAIFPTRQMNDKRLELQEQFFEKELEMFLPPYMKSSIREMSKKLTSMPLRDLAGRPQMVIPGYNKERCVAQPD